MKTCWLIALAVAAPLAAAPRPVTAADRADVAIRVEKDHVDFLIGPELVGRYHIGADVAKPFVWPLNAPPDVPITRAWPMEKAPPGGSTDHPHQKSAWFCHGDIIPDGLEVKDRIKGIEGVDFWSEAKGHGRIVCTSLDDPKQEKDHGFVTTRNEWQTADGRKVLDETRTLRFYSLGDSRLLVFDIDLLASVCPLTFGDTKEGSFGVRVNDRITELKGNGKIENADGKVGEKACWGQHSAWCDYAGTIDGKAAGITIFDDPSNPYPACWHSRGYGLMAANPFGRARSGFPAVKGNTDLVRLGKGEHLKLRYGILLHPGDAKEGKVAQHFQEFVKLGSGGRPVGREKNAEKSASNAAPGGAISLWPDGAPGAVGDKDEDRPTLTPSFPPADQATGTAVVVCPGGGYGWLAMDHEGRQIAEWLNRHGVAAFILKYRIAPRYHHPAPMQDVQRAVRTVRACAGEWGVNPDRVGIWGFSAGGHLASTAATHFDEGKQDAKDPVDRVSCRPDFAILCYPVITMEPPFTHGGSRANLLGPKPDPKLVENLCNEKQVTAKTPPTFLMHTTADTAVPPENSVLFYLALRKAGVPGELHVYEKGPHGVGLAQKDPVLSHWPESLAAWMKSRGLLKAR